MPRSDHNEISLFEHYAQNGDNATLRQWATKMLPELKSHLVYAQILGSEVHSGPAREEWQYDGAVGSSSGMACDRERFGGITAWPPDSAVAGRKDFLQARVPHSAQRTNTMMP